MIFMFWTGSMLEEPPAAPAWRERFPSAFTVFGDEDVLPLIKSEEARNCYQRISIPACKSDVARLLLLREYGGVYIDGHTGPGGGDALAETILYLSKYELVLFREGWKDHFGFYGNTFMLARRGPSILDMLIEKAFDNLLKHKAAEDAAPGYVPYNLFYFTGSPIMIDCMFDQSDVNAWKPLWDVKPEFKEKVHIRAKETEASDIGFAPWTFYHYRGWGQHWSERQKTERLFQSEPTKPGNDETGS
jgi:hypothetical protein